MPIYRNNYTLGYGHGIFTCELVYTFLYNGQSNITFPALTVKVCYTVTFANELESEMLFSVYCFKSIQ